VEGVLVRATTAVLRALRKAAGRWVDADPRSKRPPRRRAAASRTVERPRRPTAPALRPGRYKTKLLAESLAGEGAARRTVRGLPGLPGPRLEELRRVLDPSGTLNLHLDYREAHYVKLLL